MRHAEIRCAIGRHLAEQVRSYPSFEAIKRTWRLGCEPTRFADEENIVVLKEYRQLIVLRHGIWDKRGRLSYGKNVDLVSERIDLLASRKKDQPIGLRK